MDFNFFDAVEHIKCAKVSTQKGIHRRGHAPKAKVAAAFGACPLQVDSLLGVYFRTFGVFDSSKNNSNSLKH